MTYIAFLYLVFKRQDRRLGPRIIGKRNIEAKTLNQAKAQVTRLVKKDAILSRWHALDSQVRWSPVIQENGKRFVQKTFRHPREFNPIVLLGCEICRRPVDTGSRRY